jgi:AraC-like DNA-binding protein
MKKNNIKLGDLLFINHNPQRAWLRLFVLGFIILWVVKLQTFVLINVWKLFRFCPYSESLYFLSMFLFFNTLLFIALKNPEFISGLRKYQTSDLSNDLKKQYREKILSYMASEKPYLEPSLTLLCLSEQLTIPVRHMSQIINESFNKNFCDFINSYRVEESKKLLSKSPNGQWTILGIAYEVGFNAKSTFNTAFKKHTGKTPKEFKNSIQ